jgi:hypothetical protein
VVRRLTMTIIVLTMPIRRSAADEAHDRDQIVGIGHSARVSMSWSR